MKKKSIQKPDDKYTYGYGRFSLLGGAVTSGILIFGSAAVIFTSVKRIFSPVEINYNGMIILAVTGVIVNSFAAMFTRGETSINQRAVRLHMLEDVLGWTVVLLGAVIMRFTDISVVDPLMSVGVAIFILINGGKNFGEILEIILEKAPRHLDRKYVKSALEELDCVKEVHHIHIWSIDGVNNYASLHVVSEKNGLETKAAIRSKLKELGISHVTVELEGIGEGCTERECKISEEHCCKHGHHH